MTRDLTDVLKEAAEASCPECGHPMGRHTPATCLDCDFAGEECEYDGE